MRELASCASYLVCWFFIERVICLKDGLVTLIISLLFAFGIYALVAFAENDKGEKNI
jgi:hypothetical protein